MNWNKVFTVVKTSAKIAVAIGDAIGDISDDGKRNHSNDKKD